MVPSGLGHRFAKLFTLMGVVALLGCDKGGGTAGPSDATPTSTTGAPTEARVVPNLEAQPGETTTCPYSGRTFVVKAEHPKVDYEGKSYWICSEDAAAKVREDPAKYLDDFQG